MQGPGLWGGVYASVILTLREHVVHDIWRYILFGELPFRTGLCDMVLMGTAVALNLYFGHCVNHM